MFKTPGLVSVIVPNHGRDLSLLILSIAQSSYKNIELVIVDEGKERSAQRNIGIDRASGEYLLFLDSDQLVSPDLIIECVRLMEMGYISVYIPERLVAGGLFGAIRKWEREFYTGTAIDVVRFVRAAYCPKFDETLHGPEDSDWDRRNLIPFRAISKGWVSHNDDISLAEYLRKKAYYTKSMKRYADKWPGDKCLNIRWRAWEVFMENGKWRKVIRRPDLFLGVMFLLLLRGVVYYANR